MYRLDISKFLFLTKLIFQKYKIEVYLFSEVRQIGRLAGFSLNVSTTDVTTIENMRKSILCYKDGPNLPPLNFTTICPVNGRYVIFYNERLDTVTYPTGFEIYNGFAELCEVTVKGACIFLSFRSCIILNVLI